MGKFSSLKKYQIAAFELFSSVFRGQSLSLVWIRKVSRCDAALCLVTTAEELLRDPCMILLSAVITIDNYITIMLFVKNVLWENYFLKSMDPVSARLVWNLNASERICGVWLLPLSAHALSK